MTRKQIRAAPPRDACSFLPWPHLHANRYSTAERDEERAHLRGRVDGARGRPYGRGLRGWERVDRLRLCYWHGYAEGRTD